MGMSLSTQCPIDTLETTRSIRGIEKETRSHMFTIAGYSLDKDTGKGEFLESDIFDVGGHNWSIRFYPNGCHEAKDDDISVFLSHKSKSQCAKVQFSFIILDQNGCVLPIKKGTGTTSFRSNSDWGYPSFGKRAVFESIIKDDCFIIKCVLSVFKIFPVERASSEIVVPLGNIPQQLGHLLENGNGTDVVFEVDGQTISAHKCILAARSPVFSAQFFGLMKEKSDTTIKIEEMEALVFKALLHFIYNDSFLDFEEKKESDEKHDTKLMAQHLLIAADRYDLERLKIICEKILCDSINTSNVVTMLSLAERHNCNHLITTCLKFLASPEILQEVASTEQFKFLIGSRPLLLKKPSVKQQYSFLLPVTVVLFLYFFTRQ